MHGDLISEKLKWKSEFEQYFRYYSQSKLSYLNVKNILIDNYNGESVVMFDTKNWIRFIIFIGIKIIYI